MLSMVVPTTPQVALPVLARLYRCSTQDLACVASQLTKIWMVQNSTQEPLGVIGLRPPTTHGAEVMGGAFPGAAQREAALALIKTAAAVQRQFYAYGEAHLLPVEVLEAVGLRPVSAYTRMWGPIPVMLPAVPKGFEIVPLMDVAETAHRLAAERTYSDRIGHTLITIEAIQPGANGFDERLSQIAYDACGVPAGICRATLEGDHATLSTPGVRPSARPTELRRALLLSVCHAALSAGAAQMTLEAWGDTPQERADDLALGLNLEALTPIYVPPA